MLLNLKTIHHPATLDEAKALLVQPGTFPLYGGAALQRSSNPEVQAAVSLDALGLDEARESADGQSLELGSMLTLEQVRAACLKWIAFPRLAALADLLAKDLPETLRHTLRLGDWLVERDPQSLALTLLLAIGAEIACLEPPGTLTVEEWLARDSSAARTLIGELRVPFGLSQAAVAYEKVGRTPADAPIVAAVACIEGYPGGELTTSLALCGVAAVPLRQPEAARALDQTRTVGAALDRLVLDPVGDHWGSAEYRAAMAQVVARRALEGALEEL